MVEMVKPYMRPQAASDLVCIGEHLLYVPLRHLHRRGQPHQPHLLLALLPHLHLQGTIQRLGANLRSRTLSC